MATGLVDVHTVVAEIVACGSSFSAAIRRPSAPSSWRQRLRSLLLEYEGLQGETRAGRRYREPESLRLEEIQALLDGGTRLLVYTLVEERSFLWLVSRDALVSEVLSSRSVIEELAHQLHRLLPRSHQPGLGAQAGLVAADLVREILSPVSAHLAGAERLAVVADGALRYVPFGALPGGRETADRRS